MKTDKTAKLGALELSQHFLYEGVEYQVLTYPVSNHNPLTKRWCLNLKTLQSEYIFCNKEVKLPRGT